MIRQHKSYKYAKGVINLETPAPRYVIKQCKKFIEICEGKSEKYFIDEEKLSKIDRILKLLIMPRGLKSGQSIYDCSCGYQWLIYAALCIVYRGNLQKRRYETIILEVGRKNFKTFTIATVFILLFLLEPKFSKFYSVAPDGALSREVKTAIEEILKSSPIIYYRKNIPRFKILRDYIEFSLLDSKYIPLNYSNSRMDGKLPNVFLADEVGALPNSYAIEAMRSGQLNILNKLGCIISTKYPTANNPFEDEVNYAKKVLDGVQDDETVFSLLYEPDVTENWATDDMILKHANPVALEIPEIWEDLLKKRARAISIESARENFLTKHCNIVYQGAGTESFIDIKDLQNCRVNKIDWMGREVYVGVDLSMSNDNTAVAICAEEDGKTYGEVKTLAGAIECKVTLDLSEATLYADDVLKEQVSLFKSGTMTAGIDDDDDTVFAEILGKTVDKETGIVTSNVNDLPIYVGFGHIVPKLVGGIRKYKVEFFPKVKFKPFIADSKTKGDSLEFTTPSVEATIFENDNGDWEKHQICDTEAAANTALAGFFVQPTGPNSEV